MIHSCYYFSLRKLIFYGSMATTIFSTVNFLLVNQLQSYVGFIYLSSLLLKCNSLTHLVSENSGRFQRKTLLCPKTNIKEVSKLSCYLQWNPKHTKNSLIMLSLERWWMEITFQITSIAPTFWQNSDLKVIKTYNMTKSMEDGRYHPEVERHTHRQRGTLNKSEKSKVNKIKTCKGYGNYFFKVCSFLCSINQRFWSYLNYSKNHVFACRDKKKEEELMQGFAICVCFKCAKGGRF